MDSVSAKCVATQFAALLMRDMLRPLDSAFGELGDVASGALARVMAQRGGGFTEVLARTLERRDG